MAADGKNFKLYQYTDNEGNTWGMRVEQSVGDDADFGFGAYDPADPMFITSGRQRRRSIVLMDPNTARTTERAVGALTAAAWTDSPFTVDVAFPGKADLVTYTKIRKVDERKVNREQTQHNLPEPAADAP